MLQLRCTWKRICGRSLSGVENISPLVPALVLQRTFLTSPVNSKDSSGDGAKSSLQVLTEDQKKQVNDVRYPSSQECPGGGGYLTKFCTGRLRPEVQPLTLSYTILAEKVPLLPFIEKRYPFHIPILGSLVLVFM